MRDPVTTATGAGAKDWDFHRYEPSLVVINIGTNDKNSNVPSATFQSTYVKFLQAIRAKFPRAEIFALRTFGDYFSAETEAAANEVIQAGDRRVHYVNTNGWLASSDYADGVHPTDAGHKKVADKLLPILKPYIDSLATVGVTARSVAKKRRSANSFGSSRLAPRVAVDGRHGGRMGATAAP